MAPHQAISVISTSDGFGAAMRLTNSPERDLAEYCVVAECVSMALP
jgi:hypothetical protein